MMIAFGSINPTSPIGKFPIPSAHCQAGRKILSVWNQSACVCVQKPGSPQALSLRAPYLRAPSLQSPCFSSPYLGAWYLHPEPGWRTPVSWTMDTVWIRWQRPRISHLHICPALKHCTICMLYMYAICYKLYAISYNYICYMLYSHKSSPHLP